MLEKYNSLSRIITFIIISIAWSSYSQDSLVLEEIQTYYLDGTIKSINKYRYNTAGKIVQNSIYNSSNNTVYHREIIFDSLDRPIREVSSIDDEIIDSTSITYTNDTLKTKIIWTPDYQVKRMLNKKIIHYNNHLPINEFTYQVNTLSYGDTILKLINEIRYFYDEHLRLVTDSTFKSDNRFVVMYMQKNEKINSATVVNYYYTGAEFTSSIKINEYGNIYIVNSIQNNDGDPLKYEQISIIGNDSTSIITNYSYEKKRGRKVQTTTGNWNLGFSRIIYNKQGKRIISASYEKEKKMLSKTEYLYNNQGYIIEEKNTYLAEKKPINMQYTSSMGYIKKFLYKKYR